jgi:hypothetical protein
MADRGSSAVPAEGPTARGVDARTRVLSARSVPLWFGVLAPPLAWAAHLVLGDGIFELGCARGFRDHRILGVSLRAWATIQTSFFAAVTILAGVLAYRAWLQLRSVEPEGVAVGRARAMAIAGVASSILYFLIILFGFFPPLFLQSCRTSL